MSKTITLELFTFDEELPTDGSNVLLVRLEQEYWAEAVFRLDFKGNPTFDLGDGTGDMVFPDGEDLRYLWCYKPSIAGDLAENTGETSPAQDPAHAAPSYNDPIITAIQSRANELALSSLQPEAIARKLREELSSIAGQSAITYHIGANYNSTTNEIKFQIARLSPSLVVRLSSNLSASDLSIAYTKETSSGWKIEVGLIAKHYRAGKSSEFLNGLSGSRIEAEFGVTIRK